MALVIAFLVIYYVIWVTKICFLKLDEAQQDGLENQGPCLEDPWEICSFVVVVVVVVAAVILTTGVVAIHFFVLFAAYRIRFGMVAAENGPVCCPRVFWGSMVVVCHLWNKKIGDYCMQRLNCFFISWLHS
jgi:hypothetical protein